ncbi:MAG: pyridoxamine 5'-phosphate oxidase family protein [Acidimicrobiia bacterium]
MTDTQLITLDLDACLEHLRYEKVGRIAVVHDEYPIVVPVNYRFVEAAQRNWIAIRTRAGNIIERASPPVAFEIDGIDDTHRRGWSVLVRGTLLPVDEEAADFKEQFDTETWLSTDRDSWLVIEPFSISGRALEPGTSWPFSADAYL